ncbi:hypothetical protein FBZ93_111245 [Bradyrhizobium macuxiense]|uniref:Uncharacterized protein n=1 Tax=Bradyrhizobium macuxiense TaxID=1755647 RepID=A0A560LCA0_9BRAD|nr:hypothetical protein [Bradyrhizobium macuxiense]TWB93206.1 hypothetical protein FBZ93_111245 [Bradyrhizobium macuxiense]
MPKIESGKPLHCVELVTGKNLTGTILISDDEIRAAIFSYTGHFNIKIDQPVFLQTETNEIVSLHSNLMANSGTNSRSIAPERATRRQEIISNLAVIGHDPWTAEDRVKRVVFRVKHTKQLMHHEAKVEAIGRSRFPEEEHLTIFHDAADGMTLNAWYAATYGMEFDTPKELWPTFGIEFGEPRPIRDYILHVSDYVDFLSFCLGVKLKPSAIRIDRLSFAQMKEAVGKHEYPGNHGVHYTWPETEVSDPDLWIGGSPVRAWDDDELASLRACLVIWMNRAASWRDTYNLMMAGFGLKNVVSSERLLNACRWLEDIPVGRAQPALSSSDIDAITAAAVSKALELGHGPAISERIANAVRWVRAETAEQRFKRLLSTIEEKFGNRIFPPQAIDHLKRANGFRNKSAHGHFTPESDAEFRAFSKSTRAMEALCYLLTALDLPIGSEGLERIRSNPVVRDYHMAYD